MSSEVRLIENWREKWEPVTTHGRPIVAAVEIGGRIEVWALASNLGMATYGSYYLIPKPQPKKLRPWKPEPPCQAMVEVFVKEIRGDKAVVFIDQYYPMEVPLSSIHPMTGRDGGK